MRDVYFSLFFYSLMSATILPGGSEVLLGAYAIKGYPLFSLWLWASLGNTAGSAVNAALGRWLLHYRHRRWFPIKEKELSRAQLWFDRYGKWSLLMAWMPIFGDALTFVAGVMRVRWPVFLVLLFIGKGVRYAFVVGVVDSAMR